jgi:hypothetical protein
VGCSTPELPKAKWIEGRASAYTGEGGLVPLKPLASGGGACEAQGSAKAAPAVDFPWAWDGGADDCGESRGRGRCSVRALPATAARSTLAVGHSAHAGVSGDSRGPRQAFDVPGACVCSAAFTGPWCAAHAGGDPKSWAREASLGPAPPLALPPQLAGACGALAA